MLFHDAFTDLIMVTSAFRFANMELYLSSYLCYLVMYCHMLCMLCFFALCSTFFSLLFPFFAFVAVVFQQYLSVSSTCSLVVCDMIVFVFGVSRFVWSAANYDVSTASCWVIALSFFACCRQYWCHLWSVSDLSWLCLDPLTSTSGGFFQHCDTSWCSKELVMEHAACAVQSSLLLFSIPTRSDHLSMKLILFCSTYLHGAHMLWYNSDVLQCSHHHGSFVHLPPSIRFQHQCFLLIGFRFPS